VSESAVSAKRGWGWFGAKPAQSETPVRAAAKQRPPGRGGVGEDSVAFRFRMTGLLGIGQSAHSRHTREVVYPAGSSWRIDVAARAPLRRGAPAPVRHTGQRACCESGRSAARLGARHQLQPDPRTEKAPGILREPTCTAGPQHSDEDGRSGSPYLLLNQSTDTIYGDVCN